MRGIFFLIFTISLSVTDCLLAPATCSAKFTVQTHIARSDTTYSISGTVVNFFTNKPVTNATVSIQEQEKSVQTSSTGTFELYGLIKGTYTVQITDDGYREYDMTVKAGPDSQPIIIKLTPLDSH